MGDITWVLFGQYYTCIAAVTYNPGDGWNPAGDAHWAAITNRVCFGQYCLTTNVFPNQQAVEIAYACASEGFCHAGGKIVLAGWDGSTQNGTPCPTFALYNFIQSQQLSLSIQSVTNNGASGSGYNYGVTVLIRNDNLRFASGPFSLQLTNALDVSSSSGTVAVPSIPANSTGTASFTFFSAGSNTLTGQFQLINCTGANDGSPINLLIAQAVMQFSFGGSVSCGGGCTSLCAVVENVSMTNIGVVPVTGVTYLITATAAVFAAAIIVPSGTSAPDATICAESYGAGSLAGTSGALAPGAADYLFFGIKRASLGSPTAQTITFASNAGGVTFPNLTRFTNLT